MSDLAPGERRPLTPLCLGFNIFSLAHSLSLTSTLSASVVLASRLPTNTHVFALVLFAVVLFALAPSLLKQLRVSTSSTSCSYLPSADHRTLDSHLVQSYTAPLACTLFLVTLFALSRSSAMAAAIFVTLTLSICVLAPIAMVWNWTEKRFVVPPLRIMARPPHQLTSTSPFMLGSISVIKGDWDVAAPVIRTGPR